MPRTCSKNNLRPTRSKFNLSLSRTRTHSGADSCTCPTNAGIHNPAWVDPPHAGLLQHMTISLSHKKLHKLQIAGFSFNIT